MEPKFNPSRLGFARRRRGLTKQAAAAAVGADPRAFTAWESGEYPPGPERLQRLAETFDFPETFFFGEDLPEVALDSISFRALTKRTSGEINQAHTQATQAVRLSAWLDATLNLPPADLPDLRDHTPDSAAEVVRNLWGLGDRPVPHLIRLLERQGVRVFSLALESDTVDAFSFFDGDRPVILLNTRKSAERSRFDAAHELGHLLLHRHGPPRGQDSEAEAHRFASSFLMPHGSVLARAPRFPYLANLIELKTYWAVSLAALVKRFHDLDLITEWKYRTLMTELTKAGYRTAEPSPTSREGSYLWPKVFALLKERGYGKGRIAREAEISTRDLDGLMFGLAITSMRGGRGAGPRAIREDDNPPPVLSKVK